MANLPTVEELKKHRDAYNARVKSFIEGQGETFHDKAISAPGARYILQTLEAQADKVGPGHTVLDMGTGFSTFFVGLDWCKRRGWRYVAVEHDKTWLRFLRGLVDEHVRRQGGLSHPVTLLTRSSWESRWHSEMASGIIRGPFEAIIVDQNPSLETRAEDTPRLSTTLSETGVMLFDDWRPKHEGRIRRAFEKAKGKWEIGSAGDGVRRFPRDKTIGWARRA